MSDTTNRGTRADIFNESGSTTLERLVCMIAGAVLLAAAAALVTSPVADPTLPALQSIKLGLAAAFAGAGVLGVLLASPARRRMLRR